MQVLPVLTLVVLFVTATRSYLNYRDVTHPAVFMAPFFALFYGVWPLILNANGYLEELLPDLAMAQWCFLLSIAAFFGAMQMRRTSFSVARKAELFSGIRSLSNLDPQKLYKLSLVLGALALLSYMDIVGGPFNILNAYSTGKGGGYSSSGITGEGILLSYPALIILALHCRLVGRITHWHILLALLIMMPHLMHGTLGGRRGPLFVSTMSLFFSWFLAKGRLPNIRQLAIVATVLPLMMIFLVVNRQDIYVGSDFDLSTDGVYEYIAQRHELHLRQAQAARKRRA